MSTAVRTGLTDLAHVEAGLILGENVEFYEDFFELAPADVLVDKKEVVLVFGDLVERHNKREIWSGQPM